MATSPKEFRRQHSNRREWATVDPVTLVSAARETLYREVSGGDGGKDTASMGPLDEIISRFDQLTRASLGTALPQMQESGGQQ